MGGLSKHRVLLRQIVADRRGRDAAFAHRVADLVEPEHHIARRVKPRHAAAVVTVDFDARILGQRGELAKSIATPCFRWRRESITTPT